MYRLWQNGFDLGPVNPEDVSMAQLKQDSPDSDYQILEDGKFPDAYIIDTGNFPVQPVSAPDLENDPELFKVPTTSINDLLMEEMAKVRALNATYAEENLKLKHRVGQLESENEELRYRLEPTQIELPFE